MIWNQIYIGIYESVGGGFRDELISVFGILGAYTIYLYRHTPTSGEKLLCAYNLVTRETVYIAAYFDFGVHVRVSVPFTHANQTLLPPNNPHWIACTRPLNKRPLPINIILCNIIIIIIVGMYTIRILTGDFRIWNDCASSAAETDWPPHAGTYSCM